MDISFSTDHPRIRGVHQPGWSQERSDSGSSPHTRGAPRGYYDYPWDYRIIPAYAGCTFSCLTMCIV